MVTFRSHLSAVGSYGAAKRPPADGGSYARLAANESPFPPLPGVEQAIRESIVDVNRYPDTRSTAVREALADRFGIPSDHFVVGTGSVALIGQLLATIAEPGAEVVYPWRSFEAYKVFAELADTRVSPVPLIEHRIDLDRVLQAITPATRVVFICNPNNPSGTAVNSEALSEFCAAVPERILIVLDEAYAEFAADSRVNDVSITERFENVVVLRTFSKAYGLAGLRVGYAASSARIASTLQQASTPFAVSAVGQAAAVAAMSAEDELTRRLRYIRGERERITASLRAVGVEVPDSAANFVWLPLGEASLKFARYCELKQVLVRPFAGDGVRCTVGLHQANDRLIEIAGTWMSSGEGKKPA